MFGKVELSASSYDTAWVSMVPSRESPNQPCFPECLDWILENQHPNGSWGLYPSHSSLLKDSLSSTLACLLALQKWGVGEQLVHKGLDLIGANRYAINDKLHPTPIGFDIVFPGMITHALQLGLNLPMAPDHVDVMLRNRDFEVERGMRKSFAYVAEGLSKSYDSKEWLIHQRRNGSFFNSPATTAAALIHDYDDKSFEYLRSVLKAYGDAVPTIHPFDLSIPLYLVDSLVKLGIDRFFRIEIETVLDEAYRCWKQTNEDMFSDVACCAMAFRLLRMNGYDVSSDGLVEFIDHERFVNEVSLQFQDTKTFLELYKAAETTLYEHEPILDEINGWTSHFLKHKLFEQEICDQRLAKEVEYALKYSNRSVDRLEHRRNIELYNVDDYQMLKTSYRCSNIDKMDILKFAILDFNKCQAIHFEELEQHERWVTECKFDELNVQHHWASNLHFQTASVLFSPELPVCRSTWVKGGVIATLVDDLFETDASQEEISNLIELVEKWEEPAASTVNYCSKSIEILYRATYDMIEEFASSALIHQGRCVKHHLIQLQLHFIKCVAKEVEWVMTNSTPNQSEYLANGIGSSAMGLWCMNAFVLGVAVSEESFKSAEFWKMRDLAGEITRMLNDIQSDERESTQWKVNWSAALEDVDKEEAHKMVRKSIESKRRELLRLVLKKEGSVVPKEVKEAIWKASVSMHYLFTGGDEYRHPGRILADMEAIYTPIVLP